MNESLTTTDILPVLIDSDLSLNQSYRYDRDIALNGIAFKESFQDEANDVINILKYISYTYQYNHTKFYYQFDMFSNIIPSEIDNYKFFMFDPDEFCNFTKDNRDNFRKKHPFPQYLRDKFGKDYEAQIYKVESMSLRELLLFTGEKEIADKKQIFRLKDKAKNIITENFKTHLPKDFIHWDSVLDNVIYKSLSGLKMSFQFKTADYNHDISTLSRVELLKTANKHIISSPKSNNKKIFYSFYIKEAFLKNCQRLFISPNYTPDRIKSLKRTNLMIFEDYILFQKNIAVAKKVNEKVLDFNELCYVLNCTNYETERRKKKFIIDKFNEWQTISNEKIKLQFRFFSTNSLHEYQPYLVFDDVTKNTGNLKKAFYDEVTHSLMSFYIKINNEPSIEKYKVWLNSKANFSNKITIFRDLHYDILKESLNSNVEDKFFKYIKDNTISVLD